MTLDVSAIQQTFKRVEKHSEGLSTGVNNPNLIEDSIGLLKEEANLKFQTKVVRAKDEMLGYLIDTFK